ncbi:toxin-antitoxin system HicB family antitoxin [Furfurilactobacillus sp. WILCCON 0119]|uniref:toxin-antitoxin system HicB family antitoxin n=1 Tax=Furfurilactobacillus entadae TaxID=2922307 RepID=UPI0035EA54E2
MADNSQEKRFLLRLDQSLYDKIASAAQRENRSVNAHIVTLLAASVDQSTFEGRQIIGQTISGTALNAQNGLVALSGIYYRYLIDNNDPIDATARYMVLENQGNILTLKRL